MGKVSQTIKGYIWWTSPRGSVHYDVMVTLILAFIFLTPLWINFRDKPQERPPHQTEVVVQQEDDGFLYKVDASAVKADSDADIRESLAAHYRTGRRRDHDRPLRGRCVTASTT